MPWQFIRWEHKDGRQGENHSDFTQDDIRFTNKDDVLYAFVLAPPTEDIVIKTLASGGLFDRKIAGIELMGSDEKIKWNRNASGLKIELPKFLGLPHNLWVNQGPGGLVPLLSVPGLAGFWLVSASKPSTSTSDVDLFSDLQWYETARKEGQNGFAMANLTHKFCGRGILPGKIVNGFRIR